MNTYIVIQDVGRFEVRLNDAKGPVVATFSNKLAAEVYVEKHREPAPRTIPPTDDSPRRRH